MRGNVCQCPGRSQQTQNIFTTFIQRRPNVFAVGPTLYKCYTTILCSLGSQPAFKPWWISGKLELRAKLHQGVIIGLKVLVHLLDRLLSSGRWHLAGTIARARRDGVVFVYTTRWPCKMTWPDCAGDMSVSGPCTNCADLVRRRVRLIQVKSDLSPWHIPLHQPGQLCKAKRQHLLTCRVSRCCLLDLHGRGDRSKDVYVKGQPRTFK